MRRKPKRFLSRFTRSHVWQPSFIFAFPRPRHRRPRPRTSPRLGTTRAIATTHSPDESVVDYFSLPLLCKSFWPSNRIPPVSHLAFLPVLFGIPHFIFCVTVEASRPTLARRYQPATIGNVIARFPCTRCIVRVSHPDLLSWTALPQSSISRFRGLVKHGVFVHKTGVFNQKRKLFCIQPATSTMISTAFN